MEHNIEDWSCWCQPRVEQPCPVCEGAGGALDCEHCAGTGWSAAYDPDAPAVVVHQEGTYA